MVGGGVATAGSGKQLRLTPSGPPDLGSGKSPVLDRDRAPSDQPTKVDAVGPSHAIRQTLIPFSYDECSGVAPARALHACLPALPCSSLLPARNFLLYCGSFNSGVAGSGTGAARRSNVAASSTSLLSRLRFAWWHRESNVRRSALEDGTALIREVPGPRTLMALSGEDRAFGLLPGPPTA